MVVIKAVLHSAITGKEKVLGEVLVINDGTGTKQRGNYNVVFRRARSEKRVRVENFPRLSKDIWELLRRGLNGQN